MPDPLAPWVHPTWRLRFAVAAERGQRVVLVYCPNEGEPLAVCQGVAWGFRWFGQVERALVMVDASASPLGLPGWLQGVSVASVVDVVVQ